eukprot:5933216-Prymnesium_polylepis.1
MLTTVSGASSLGDSTTAVPPTLSPAAAARRCAGVGCGCAVVGVGCGCAGVGVRVWVWMWV